MALPKVGQRVELLAMPNDPDPVPAGTRGKVTRISGPHLLPGDQNPWHQIDVDWDNGRTLSLLTTKDRYRVVPTFVVRGVALVQAVIEAEDAEAARVEFLEGRSLSELQSRHWESRQVVEVGSSEEPLSGDVRIDVWDPAGSWPQVEG